MADIITPDALTFVINLQSGGLIGGKPPASGSVGPKGDPGAPGINGTNGAPGKSAYQSWLDVGNTGTEAQFVASLVGPAGPAGPQGIQGIQGPKGDAGGGTVVTPPVVFPEMKPPPVGTVTGKGISPGSGTITDTSGAVWSIRLADRVVLKNGAAQAQTNMLELWDLAGVVWAFDGMGYTALTTTALTAPQLPNTAGLRLPVGPQLLTSQAGVQIAPGANIQAIVDANPAGTTYVLGVGTHVQQVVTPKRGDQFVGLFNGTAGAVMDGQDAVQFAFYIPNGTDYVVIKNLSVKRYTAPVQWCQIMSLGAYTIIQNCDVSLATNGGGVWAADHNLVIANHIHHNAQLGFKVNHNTTTGGEVTLGCCFDSNEVDNNDPTDFFYPVVEQGGSKIWYTDHFTAQFNDVHDNKGPGLWMDYANIDFNFYANRVVNNTHHGIEHEIGYNGKILWNYCAGNGSQQSLGWNYAGGGISIINSGGITSGSRAGFIEIAYNTVIAGPKGRLITFVEGDRGGAGNPGFSADPWRCENTFVHHNICTAGELNETQVGVVGSHDFTRNDIVFDYNAYLNADALNFFWKDAWYNFAQWQAGPKMDLNGSATYDTALPGDPPTLSKINKNAALSVSASGLIATDTSGQPTNNHVGLGRLVTTEIKAGDKIAFEMKATTMPVAIAVGVGNAKTDCKDGAFLGNTPDSVAYYSSGEVYCGFVLLGTLPAYHQGDRVNVLVTGDNQVWFGVNGVMSGNPAAGTGGFSVFGLGSLFPAYNLKGGCVITANFGPTLTDAIPAGFNVLKVN